MNINGILKFKAFIFLIISLFCTSNIAAQDFWGKLPGPDVGWVNRSAIDTSGGMYDGTIFVAPFGGGMFRSTDNGNNWTELNMGVNFWALLDIAIGSSVFAATSEGIYRSDDNGETWQLKQNGVHAAAYCYTLYIDNSNTIYAGHAVSGVYYSTDNGENWIGSIGAGLTDERIYTLIKNSAGELFAGGPSGIFRSTDNGQNWIQINNGLNTSRVIDNLVIFYDAFANENIIAGTSGDGVFISNNNGDLWQQSNNGLSSTDVECIVNTTSNELFVGTVNDIFKSTDYGNNWIPSGLFNQNVNSISLNRSNEIFAGTRKGNYRSSDAGSTWDQINNGFNSGPVFDLDINSVNDIFVIHYEGVSASFDNGNVWHRKEIGLADTTYYFDIKINENDDIFVGTDDGIYKSDDNGNSWSFKGLTGEYVYQIEFNNNDHIFAGTSEGIGGLYRSENNGDTWVHLDNLLEDNIQAIAINLNDNTIFAGEYDNGVFRSTDNGDTWTQVNNNLSNTQIQSLAVNSVGHIFAGTYGGGIFRSLDNGDNWVEINNGMIDTDVRSICINTNDHIYIGTRHNSIFFSNNNGNDWINLSEGILYQRIYDIAVDNNNYIIATTFGGIYKSIIPTILPSPTLSSPANGATGIPANPTIEWNAVFGADSYHLQISDDINFSTIIFEQMGIQGTLQQVSGLDGTTTYFWKVRAENFIGGSDWSNTWNFTTVALPQFILQNATNISDVSATLNGEVNPNGHEVAVGFEFGEDNSYGNFVLATPDTFNGAANQFVYADVSGLHTDWDIHFRVVVNQVDGQFTIHGMDQTFHTQSYPTSIDISTNIPFPTYDNPSDYGAGDYRIIGLPGAKDSPYDLVNILSGVHKTAWQAYWDNGTYSDNHNDYLIEFDGSGNFRLGGGNAVWLINKGNFNINISGIQSMPTDGDDNVRINLHNGWNLITSPFVRSVPWWAIQQTNSIAVPLYEFTGGWNTSDFLNPYQGYMFDNTTNLTELIVPYKETLPKPALNDTYNWRVKIALQINELLDNSSYLGVSEYSSVGRDYLDFKKPHAVGSVPSVYFERSKWDNNYTTYATDIRPPIDELESWEIQVYANTVETAELIFKQVLDVPEKFDVILLDRVNTKYVDLRKSNSYQFNPITEITDFEILVGYRELLQNELKTLLPTEFKLGNNFPNPFNPMTTIPVSIPKDTEISLKIYNVLGQEINTIFNGFKETGNHYFRWDGNNYLNQQVAAGIYLYKLIIKNENVFVGKMVLIK